MSTIKYRQNETDFESNIRVENLAGETFKGAPLSNNEVDTNFANLNIGKVENDGSIPMTGNLTAPGINSSDQTNGFRLYNQNGDLVFTAGEGNDKNVTFEGNIDVGDQGAINLNVGGGDIVTKNLYLNGRLIDQALSEEYKVSNVGEVMEATVLDSPTLSLDGNHVSGDTTLDVTSVANVFVGDSISSVVSGIPANTTITAINSNTITISNGLSANMTSGANILVNEGKMLAKFATICKLVQKVGTFGVGETVQGNSTGFQGVVHKVEGNNVWVVMNNDTQEFSGSEFLQQIVGGIPDTSIQGLITEVINTDTIKIGHKIKVFGVQANDPATPTDEASPTPAATATKNGTTDTGLPTQNFYYWTSQFRFDNGKIGEAAGPTDVIAHNTPVNFTSLRYNALSLTRSSGDYGMLVYRGTTTDLQDAELIAVLGPRELGSITSGIIFNDQGTFTRTEWSSKTNDTNAFTVEGVASGRMDGEYSTPSNMVYMPQKPPTNEQINTGAVNARGFHAATVEKVYNKKTLRFSQKLYHGSNYVQLVHDNTAGLQLAINEFRDLALRNIVLPDGVYYTSRITIPDNFAVIGNSKRAVIKAIPWNFDHYDDVVSANEKGCILTPQTDTPTNITFRNLTIDGNMVNNVTWTETQSNFPITMPQGQDIVYDNIDVLNTVGSGLYALDNDRIRISGCKFRNGGLKYGEDEALTPLLVSSSTFTTVSDNIFENWTSSIDASVTRIGTIIGNTIRNCGSGLLIFGSGNLISSPNLIMGTDDEFIPAVDTMDSDFDSINVKLDLGVDYQSPSMLYLRRGAAMHLGDNQDLVGGVAVPGTEVTLSADILALTKRNNVEALGAIGGSLDYSNNSSGNPIITVPINGNGGDFGLENGYFQWKITSANVNQLPSFNELKADWTATSPPSDESLIGLIYRIKATEYAYAYEADGRILVNNFEKVDSNTGKFTLKSNDDKNVFAIGDVIKTQNVSGATLNFTGSSWTVTAVESNGAGGFRVVADTTTDLTTATTASYTSSADADKPYLIIRNTFVLAKGRLDV